MSFKQASAIIGLAATLFATSPMQATAVPINDITLFNSQSPGNVWVTWTTSHWILGVSDQPNGPLLNTPTASVAGIPEGNYWLFADPADLGLFPELRVNFTDGSSMSAIFQIVGSNGAAQPWIRLTGNPELSLGWAAGTADLVGTFAGILPDGVNDFYMRATIGTGVPEPSSAWLLGFGLLGLIGIAKQFNSKANA